MGEVRERKKLKTRQRISDVATRLFFKHGFDAVTVEDVARAAKVSKMTVFNYFARKEELMLDREDDLKMVPLRRALRARLERQSASEAIRDLAASLVSEKSPLTYIDHEAVAWWQVIAASPALKARMRELGEEAAEGLAQELYGPNPDGRARLIGGAIVLTIRTAREEAVRLLMQGASIKKANAACVDLLTRGLAALGLMT